MTHLLLLGAGFSHNWGAPLAKAVNGSLLRDLHDDPVLERALRDQPFENALADFFKVGSGGDQRHQRLQVAVTALFDRINQSLGKRTFEFSNDRANSVKDFLERFDAIFTLNQDLLFEIAYLPRFISLKWTAAEVPGMQASYEQGRPTLMIRPSSLGGQTGSAPCGSGSSRTSSCMVQVTGSRRLVTL